MTILTNDDYNSSAQRAVGLMFANMIKGMLEGGLTREEAVKIACAYAAAAAGSQGGKSSG